MTYGRNMGLTARRWTSDTANSSVLCRKSGSVRPCGRWQVLHEIQPSAAGSRWALISGMNDVLDRRGVGGCVYGLASYFHIALGAGRPAAGNSIEWDASAGQPPRMKGSVTMALRRAMLNQGVDLMGGAGGFVSGVHTEADIEFTIDAFAAGIESLAAEGTLA